MKTMEVLGLRQCPKHSQEAHQICSSAECFERQDILVCPSCSSRHRGCEVVEVALLNEKVHELMKKRLEFEQTYHSACEEWLNEFRKFKVFKEELMSVLNTRERHLNDICRKIRRTIPYEKDRQLFKKTLGELYLSTRAINPNHDLYRKFTDVLADTINDCNRALHTLRLNRSEVPLLLKKEQPICAVLREVGEAGRLSVPPIAYCEPPVGQFKKETVRYSKQTQAENVDSSLCRISDSEFIAHNSRSEVVQLYSSRSLGLPKTLYIGSEAEHLEVLGRNLFITDHRSHIFIYDLLSESLLKEYASTNHKAASITALLALDRSVVLNFIHNPNQIVALALDPTLRVSKGIETKSRTLAAARLGDEFVAAFEDKRLRIFESGSLEKASEYELESGARSLAVMDAQTVLAGGESVFVEVVDKRAQGLVGKFNMQRECSSVVKIYPTAFLANLGNCLTLYEFRMQKELLRLPLDAPVKHLEVLSSTAFVTSGKQLAYYEAIP
jgi:hypothetical protein